MAAEQQSHRVPTDGQGPHSTPKPPLRLALRPLAMIPQGHQAPHLWLEATADRQREPRVSASNSPESSTP